jgi:hypothetical protein
VGVTFDRLEISLEGTTQDRFARVQPGNSLGPLTDFRTRPRDRIIFTTAKVQFIQTDEDRNSQSWSVYVLDQDDQDQRAIAMAPCT